MNTRVLEIRKGILNKTMRLRADCESKATPALAQMRQPFHFLKMLTSFRLQTYERWALNADVLGLAA